MTKDPLSQNRDKRSDMSADEGIQEGLYPFQHDPNITEGGEFLDDAIRTRDQPLCSNTLEENE